MKTTESEPRNRRLTEKEIRTLPTPEKGNRIYFDDIVGGFGIRVTASGTKAFVFDYRVNRRHRRLTIGRYPSWNATAARERAKKLKLQVDRGRDPLGEKEEGRAAPTLADVAAEYLERYASKKKSGFRDKQYLTRDVLPSWGNRKAADIKRRDVLELIERKAEQAPISANRLLACIRKVFNWAISRDLLDTNPCSQVPAPGIEKRRDRVLTEAEIAAFWDGLDSAPMRGEVRTALRLILVTSQRPGEVCEIELADLNGDWWTVPAAKAKNGLSHRVPLSALAQEQLQPRREATERWLFPSPRGNAPIQVNALSVPLRNNNHFGLERFTPHDLRRTAATMMASMGTDRLTLSKILNHVETGVTSVYDRATYDREKRRALERWERKLRSIIGGELDTEKVVSIG